MRCPTWDTSGKDRTSLQKVPDLTFQRFPKDMNMAVDFAANLYFSPVCPSGGGRRDDSLSDIRHVEFKMKRSGE